MDDIRDPGPRRNGRGHARGARGHVQSETYNRIARFTGMRPHVYVRVGNYEFCFVQMHKPGEEEYDLDVGRFILEYVASPDSGQPNRVRRIHESDDLPDPVEAVYDLAFNALDVDGAYARAPGIPAHLVRYIGDLDRRVDQLRYMGSKKRIKP